MNLKRLFGLKSGANEPGRAARQSGKRDDSDDGVGVPVPTGPRPLRGGAHAKPPPLPQESPSLELVGSAQGGNSRGARTKGVRRA